VIGPLERAYHSVSHRVPDFYRARRDTAQRFSSPGNPAARRRWFPFHGVARFSL